MARAARIALLVVVVLAGVSVAAILASWLLVRSDWAGEKVAVGLAKALDMNVDIGAPLGLSLSPAVRITLADLQVSRQGQTVATAERVNARVDPFGLLGGKLQLRQLHIEQPEFWLERYLSGETNRHKSSPESAEVSEFAMQRLQVSNARLRYRDQVSDQEWLLADCDLHLSDIAHPGGAREHALAALVAGGELDCGGVTRGSFTVGDLAVGIHVDNGVLDLEPVQASVLGGKATGRLHAEQWSGTPTLSLQARVSGLDLGQLLLAMKQKQRASGRVDLEFVLDANGKTPRTVGNSLSGKVSMRAEALTFSGFDLDAALANYADTQRFNLVDTAALVVGGPVGLAVTRGHAFAGLLNGGAGSTRIEGLVSEWRIEGGVARAHDVAFRTEENRLALSGAVDIGNSRFKDLRVAVVDAAGCAVVEQSLSGPFHNPEIEQPNFLVAAAGPVIDLFKRGVQKITDKDCEVFYAGILAHP